MGVALAVGGVAACKGKGDAAGTSADTAALDQRCEQVAKVCGDTAKHVDKILGECKQAVAQQGATGCATAASALYDCYLKEICGGAEKVWALDDIRVLAERHDKCKAELAASRACGDKK